jgi:hypothetical protein
MIHLGTWDLILLAVVSTQATLLAYLPDPKWKALIMTLPIPFTLASLAVGAPVNSTHVAALNLLLGYTHGVRLLHDRAKLPIILAILISAAGYCLAGALLRPVLPQSGAAFWVACVLTLIVAVAAHALYRRHEEPGHRSHLPFWIKFPLVAGVILALILMKRILQGFMTMFPMVGLIAAYEARHSLWTLSRSGPAIVLGLGSMAGAMRLLQAQAGWSVAPSVAVGFLVWAAVALPIPFLLYFTMQGRVSTGSLLYAVVLAGAGF